MHSPHDATIAASFDALDARFDALEARLDRITRAVLAFGVTFALSQLAVIVTILLRT